MASAATKIFPFSIFDIFVELFLRLSNQGLQVLVDGGDGADVELLLKHFENGGGEKGGQRRNSVAGLSKIDRQTVGFLIRIS